MDRRHGIVCILCIFSFMNGVLGTYSAAMETEIRNETIFNASYDYVSRPSAQTIIRIGINVLAIDELNLKGQKLTLAGWLTLEWHDDRLMWDKAAKNNMTYIFTQPQYIWKPELLVDNSLSQIEVIYDRYLNLRIKYNGEVSWDPLRLFTTHCQVDITYYPYDRQKCGIELVSWGYSIEEVVLQHLFEAVNLEDFVQHGEWVIESTSIEDKNLTEHHSDGTILTYPQLDFWIHLKRRTEFYNLNVMMPVILTSLMVGFVFIVPINSGEKVSFVLTVFLSLAVLLTIVSDTLPPTSITTSILGLYLGIVLVSAAFGILLTVLILILFHRKGKPDEHHILLLVTRLAAKCICWQFPEPAFNRSGNSSRNGLIRVTPIELSDLKLKKEINSNKNKNDVKNSGNKKNNDVNSVKNDVNSMTSSELHLGDCDYGYDNEEVDVTWQRVAQILDRFIFFVFFSVNVLMNVTFVLILSTGDGTAQD